MNLSVALNSESIRLTWQRSLAGTIDSFEIEILPDGVTLENCIGLCFLNLSLTATCLENIDCGFDVPAVAVLFGQMHGFSVRSVNCRANSELVGPVHIQGMRE